MRRKHHPPVQKGVGFGCVGSIFWLLGALHLALDGPHPSPFSVLSVNGPLGPLEVVFDAKGPFHRAETDRRLEKTANFKSVKRSWFHPHALLGGYVWTKGFGKTDQEGHGYPKCGHRGHSLAGIGLALH